MRAVSHDQMGKLAWLYLTGPLSHLSKAAHSALPEALPLAPENHTSLSLQPPPPGLWVSWAAPTLNCFQPNLPETLPYNISFFLVVSSSQCRAASPDPFPSRSPFVPVPVHVEFPRPMYQPCQAHVPSTFSARPSLSFHLYWRVEKPQKQKAEG